MKQELNTKNDVGLVQKKGNGPEFMKSVFVINSNTLLSKVHTFRLEAGVNKVLSHCWLGVGKKQRVTSCIANGARVQDNRLGHYFALFWGFWLLLG